MAKKNKKSFLSRVIYWTLFSIIVYAGVNTLTYADTLKFAHLSDVHLSTKSVDTSYKALSSSKDLLKDAIQQINDTPKIDFVIETGDLIDKPKKDFLETACQEMNKLKPAWYFAFGNHDVAIGSSFKKELYFNYIKKHNKSMSFEKPYYTFEPKKGYKVIVLDATIDNKITSNGEIPQEEIFWLKKELEKAYQENQLAMIFLHHPLHEPYPSFHHRIINADEVMNVIKEFDMPIAIFTGHYHAAKLYKDGKILHVSTPSLVSYPNAFRIITINNLKDRIIFNFDFKETNLKDIQKKTKLMTFSASMLKGEESDQSTIVIINK